MPSAEALTNQVPPVKQHLLPDASGKPVEAAPEIEKEALSVQAAKEFLSVEQPHPKAGTPYPTTTLKLEDHPIDEIRSLRVTVIGAGLAGILAGVLLPVKVPGIELTIFEKNSDVVSVSLAGYNALPLVCCY